MRSAPKSEYWVCACVRRDRSGRMTGLKFNHPDVKRCRKCGSERPTEAARDDKR